MVFPFFFSWAVYQRSIPWPREAERESMTMILASGNSGRRSSAAMQAD